MLYKTHNKHVSDNHVHLTNKQNNTLLLPHLKQNTSHTHSFRGLDDFGTNYRL